MKTYNTATSVHLIKTQERKEFAKGVPALKTALQTDMLTSRC